MRIEMKHQAEIDKRKGLTWKTLLAVLWLFASFLGSYLFTNWLIDKDYLDINYVYQNLMIPESISETVLTLILSLVIFLILQFSVLIVIAFMSPKAKRRPGDPRADTDNPDPYDKSIDYH